VDRYWFFTWRTYGTWLPGDEGFVGHYRPPTGGGRVIDNVPGEPLAEPLPALAEYSREVMTGEPVLLVLAHAEVLLGQFHETVGMRGWAIDAVAVLATHVHLVVGLPGDPDPSDVLRDWKSYASRALNRAGAKRNAPRWWADGGSKRKLKGQENRAATIRYVRDQPDPLLVWLSEEARLLAGIPAEGPGHPGG
jgi:REP element-mobilizing transposase RayT